MEALYKPNKQLNIERNIAPMEKEDFFTGSGHEGGAIDQNKIEIYCSDDHREENCAEEIISMDGDNQENDDTKGDSTGDKDLKSVDSQADKNKLGSTRLEMDEAREENRRLKIHLNQIMKDYQTLHTRYYEIVQQESKESPEIPEEIEESELVSLSLGRRSSVLSDSRIKDEKNKASIIQENNQEDKEGLNLGLDCKFGNPNEKNPETAKEFLGNNLSSDSSLGLEKKEEEEEEAAPVKDLKTMRSDGDDYQEVLQQNPVKKARVSVRARCDTPTMNDGCQWRKYGQKISKGNPCPRAYYRCTVAASCPVRKQVQRCPEDVTILITTYEGTHNHALPLSATAMASTTSAAASMLLSRASSSSSSSSQTTATTTLQGLNFYLSDDSTKPKPFYVPNTASSLHPTITLDLTSLSSSPFSSFSSSSSSPPFSSLFSRFFSTTTSNNNNNNPFLQSLTYPSTNLNFSGKTMNSSREPNSGLFSWANHDTGFLGSYGNTTNATNSHHLTYQNRTGGGALNQMERSQLLGNNTIYQSLTRNNTHLPPSLTNPVNPQSLPSETIKAITANPSFQSALAAVLTSIVNNNVDAKEQSE